MPILDTRVRPPFGSFAASRMLAQPDEEFYKARKLSVPASIANGPDYDLFRAELRSSDVSHALVAGRVGAYPEHGDISVDNSDVLALVDLEPGLYRAALAVNCGDPATSATHVESLVRPGVVGLIVEAGFAEPARYLDDVALDPIWALCQRLGLPALLLAGGFCGPDLSYADPVHLDRLAARWPDVTFVAVKGGYPYVLETLNCAFRRPNIWLSPDLWMCNIPGANLYVEAANTFLSERFIFGSAYPFVDVGEAVSIWSSLGFDDHVRERVMFDNAMRLFER